MNPSATTPPPSVLEANPHAPVELVQESQVQQPRPSTGEPGLSSRLNSNNHQRRRRVILACENLQTAHVSFRPTKPAHVLSMQMQLTGI
ncbi:hypothetical protein LIPSTDRAFT_323003 [Lipomyces starkeyi NRRL Y-11557]|uniref:Uncharacterized protein n=1 Tax=Lipomyces starkeyi NRRL Y-11557 TaxID=675824 RepID=A0A1E3Q166_LIPST|nr:hypothetical protein LIPSTDRAFT_323003 [Lipomyces starkeyi NRRL Y-11557]